MSRIHTFAGIAGCCLAIAAPGSARAEDEDQVAEPAPAREFNNSRPSQKAIAPEAANTAKPPQAPPPRDTLTGDWGGLRTDLKNDGLTFRADYVSETMSNVDGGLKRGTGYTQQLRAGIDFDMDKIVGWKGGVLHFTVNDRRGVGVSLDYVGNRLPIQEAAGSNWFRLTEATVEQTIGNLDVRAGFFAMGNDLGGQALGCNFVNAAFCAHPLSMSGNSGWYNYPNARWGAAIRYRVNPEWAIRTGIYQVNTDLALEKNSFRPFAGDTTGVLLPLEVEYDPGAAPGSHAMKGHYKLGAYYDTSRVARKGESGMVRGRYQLYVLADQMVLRDKGNPARGLTVFGQFTANPRASSQISRWYGVGLLKVGTFKGRDADTLGLGLIHAVVNPRLRQQQVDEGLAPDGYTSLPEGETVIEMSYGFQARRWLSIRPDVQYIIDPGAFSYHDVKNAVAVGAQLKVQF